MSDRVSLPTKVEADVMEVIDPPDPPVRSSYDDQESFERALREYNELWPMTREELEDQLGDVPPGVGVPHVAAEPAPEPAPERLRWFPLGELLAHLPRYIDDESPYASLVQRVLAEAVGHDYRLGHLQVSEALYADLQRQDRWEQARVEVEELRATLAGRRPAPERVAELLQALHQRFNYSWVELARVIGNDR